MKKSRIKKFIIALLIVTIVCISVLALVIGTDKTYSTYVSVIVPEGDDVKVYVGGKDVKKSADGKNYEVNAGSTVTVTVVNEGKLFKSMTINGTSYASAVAEITVPDSGKVEISVETEEPYAEDVGKYFGNPYVLSKEADVLAVARILARGSTTPEDLAQIGADAKTTADDIRYGYYRLGTNLFINSSEFFGLGFRGGLPFGGCFDFDGYTATINLVRTSHVDSEFSFVGNTHYADYGFFAYAYGDGVRPCLIRNVKMQGFIGINTIENAETINHTDHVNVGGVAGTAGKNIVFDDVESTVSVSAQTKFADLYIGGIFGLCSSSVESWCPVRYNGAFNDVSGVTYGNNAGAIVGGFAGVLQNASVDGVTIDGERSIVLANALGNVSGSAIAGGFVGVVELGENANAEVSAPRPMSIKNVVVCAEHNYSVTAVIDNGGSANKGNINPDDFSGTSAAAVAGGIVGIVNRGNKAGSTLSDDKKIEFSNVAFVKSDISQIGEVGPSGEGRLEIKASTADGDSSGAVFAGGAVGYIYSHSAEYIVHNVLPAEETKYFFNCSVDVSATQNGVGPAYAGGAFGYNSFHIHNVADTLLKLGIVKPEYDYTVTAVQSATSTSYNNKYYNVCAGGYASRYNVGYSFDNAVFYIGSGRITAYREVGSTAIGDINAGGCVGRVFGYGSEATTIEDYGKNGSQSGTSDNVTVYYNENSRVEASCHSFSSINGTGTLGNNVCAGGAIGYVLGYSQISNLSLIFKSDSSSSGKAAEYFVSGSQNGKNAGGKDADLKTEGFVGGVFGLVIDSKLNSVSLTGDKTENSVVYFTSANSPNTASVGGLIGALWRKKITSNVTLLNGATVENVHAAGKAYCDVHGSDEYDLYVGGASESGSGISLKTDGGKDVNESNSDEYITYVSGSGTSATTYYYFRRHLGNPDTVGKVNATPVGAEYLPQNVKFYDINTNVVGKATYFDENTTQADKEARIADIIAAKGSACNVSSFNGRANVGYNYEGGEEGAAKKSVYFQANDNVRENTVILMECDYGSATYGVIVEFVPNMLTGIEIAPESGTPPLDTRVDSSGVTHYIYTAGDVVRFGATLKYKYPAPRSYVVETIYSGTGVTENGTVVVSENGYYEVSCRDLKNTKSTKVIVEAKEEVDFSFAYSGATGSTDRKMLQSCHFTFSLQPQLGYGLTPTVSLTINGVTSIGQFTENGLSVSFGGNNFLIPYTEDPDYEYSYNFVAGSDFVDYAVANGGSVAFSVTYAKIYSLVFISNYGVNEYFTTTVSAGEKFSLVNPDGFEGWTKKLINDRYGYDFKGFYTVSKAGDVSAYGKSFEDMQKDASSEVSGTMRFYARWTYNVTVESPEGVTVTSSMPRSMLEGGEIIPLDANNGFGFVIGTTSKWVGKPRYKSFIKLKDGSYTEITSAFSAASQENGYFVSSETLKGYDSGYIHIKVYADDIEFAVGDDPRYDGSALYTDGIYTVTYNVNYGSQDTVSDFAFNFALSLPKGTSMRLFYQKDGVSAWAGSLVLSEASSSVSLSEFGSMGDGSALTLAARNPTVSERFILVVTLPNNTNGFNINSATKCAIKVKNYAYKSIISNYGSIIRVEGDSPEEVDGYVGKEYTLLPAVILNATFSSGKLSFTATGTTDENVIDRRHSGVYYMWRIDKVGGGYIGNATFTSFGTEVVRTTDAIYYSATKGSSIMITESLSGYRVSLLEARNIKQPSESYEIAILTGF